MADAQSVASGSASKRVVKLKDGTVLNRYWDARDVPRTESYMDDIATAEKRPSAIKRIFIATCAPAQRPAGTSVHVGSTIRKISTIRTTEIVPVDLNALLFHLEKTTRTPVRWRSMMKRANAMKHWRRNVRQRSTVICGMKRRLVCGL